MPDEPTQSDDKPSHVVIDKNTTARVNLGILITVVVMCVGAMTYLKDIEHAVELANNTLQEVKAQLVVQNGMALMHNEKLIRQGDQLIALKLVCEKLEERVRALEGRK